MPSDDGRKNMSTAKKYESGAKNRFLFYSLALAMVVLVFTGCSTPVSGRLQNSPEVTELFKSSQILPNHKYYVSGFQRIPYAIIAIDNNYELRIRNWKPIDIDSASLNQLVYRMEHVYSLNPRGYWILDQDGSRVGAWYSSQIQTRIKRDREGRIEVASPEPPDLRGIP
jgi:hypothetical protein